MKHLFKSLSGISRVKTLSKWYESDSYRDEKLAMDGVKKRQLETALVLHDIRNLLTVIQGNAELLDSSALSSEFQERIELIMSAASTASNVAGGALDQFGGHSNRVNFELVPLLQLTIRQVSALLSKEILILEDIESEKLWVRGEPEQIQRVLLNLVKNALNALDSGVIWVRARRCHHEICIEVEDNGPGISDLSLLEFGHTTKTNKSRHGLGLTSVRDTVHQLGGRLEFATGEGKGTRFRVFVPAS